MWQKLSLRARLNLLLALVLMLGLAVNITRLVLEAGPRVQAEDQSVIRLAREFVETLVVGLNETRDPDARLNSDRPRPQPAASCQHYQGEPRSRRACHGRKCRR